MVYFQINAPAVIGKFKKQIPAVNVVERRAGGLVLLTYPGPQIALFKIVPEKTPAYNEPVKRKFLEAYVKGAPQYFRIYGFIQLTAKAENLGIPPGGTGRKYFCRVIKPAPLGIH
jgi:hypothetical protein